MALNFSEYQAKTALTARYPKDIGLMYTALGLNGEAGECAEIVKKVIRDTNGILSDAVRERLKYEISDVLWYCSQLAAEAGLSLQEIAEANLAKLFSRAERGVIHGDGDDR